MSIFILLVSFFLITCTISIISSPGFKIKDILFKSVLVFSAILVFITEFASAFHILNFRAILMSWIGFSVINIIFLYFRKGEVANFPGIFKERITNTYNGLNKYEKYFSFSAIVILILIFVQGLVYPPNNWDSMTYHLSRITNWISHQSVEHYPTHIFRQIYQPPFSEFTIMHFNILNGGDYFSNSVQLIFLIFSIFSIVSIVELFGLGRRFQFIAILLAVTIPEVILQASSTQNDIVASFFILASVYFAVKAHREGKFQNYLFLGLAIGLGTLTKGTAYIYLAPVIIFFAIKVLVSLYRTKRFSYVAYSFIALFMFICINSGHYYRNYRLSHNILGIDSTESKMMLNEKMNVGLLFSNFVKNVGLHIGPYPLNKFSNKVIYKIHSLAGIDIDNSGTNFNNIKYSSSLNIPNHEDSAPNPIHFYLIALSFIVIGLRILNNKRGLNNIILYSALILLQVILFCFYFKWQPWHTRLHTSLFLLAIPLICYALSLKVRYVRILYKVLPVIIIYAFLVVLFNSSRPFISNSRITRPISIVDNRYKKYFANKIKLYEEYKSTIDEIKRSGYQNVGLIVGIDDWEYPLFSNFYSREINPIHINVSNITKAIPPGTNAIDCVITTTINDSVIDYMGKRFYNQNNKNKVIWLYR